jgi:hypothetical protein
VSIYTCSTVDRLMEDRKTCTVSHLECHLDRIGSAEVRAKFFVCALSTEVLPTVFPYSYPKYHDLVALAKVCPQFVLGLQLYLQSRTTCAGRRATIVLIDSPWGLVIQPESPVWRAPSEYEAKGSGGTFISKRYGDGTVQEIWSIGLTDYTGTGYLRGKTWQQCTEQEIYDEVHAQLSRSTVLQRELTTSDTGQPFHTVAIAGWKLWESWSFDETEQQMTTWEPKTGANAGSWKHRPAPKSEYDNLWFGGAYARGGARECFQMETAVCSGFAAADSVLATNRSDKRRTKTGKEKTTT